MALLHTKYSEYAAHREKLEKCGFVMLPMRLVRCKINDFASLQHENSLFLKEANPFYPPVTVIRNNGIPRGAGIGNTEFMLQSAGLDGLFLCYRNVGASDQTADGAIFQQFGGMEMKLGKQTINVFGTDVAFGEKTFYAPIIGGIAYTAVLQWVYGHPKAAVDGKGNYYAFYGKDSMGEPIISNSSIHALEKEYPQPHPVELGSNEGTDFMNRYSSAAMELLGSVAESVSMLGKYGAYYIEWAGAILDGKMQKLALQVAVFSSPLLAGLDSRTQARLDEFPEKLGHAIAGLELNPQTKRLKSLYEKAINDPRTIAVGFDVVGVRKQVHNSLLYTADSNFFANHKQDVSLFIIDPKNIYLGEPEVKSTFECMPIKKTSSIGIVEIGKSPSRKTAGDGDSTFGFCGQGTFRGHLHGFFTEKGMLGLSGTQFMKEKRLALLPEKLDTKDSAIMRGKFVLEVDESLPFGTLRVERIDDVKLL
ncbi:MAG: hypothetical protein NT051_06280 [Candidatus Micrarchaeota archaeon]|nr:hypothetical protein [Candidatus Micrarchaeota archaeon]